MKLYSPRFERDLVRLVRRKLRPVPKLWAEFKRTRQTRWTRTRRLSAGLGAALIAGLASNGVFANLAQLGHPNGLALALSMQVLFITALSLFAASSLLHSLGFSHEMYVLGHFPVSDRQLADFQLHKFLRWNADMWCYFLFLFLTFIWIWSAPGPAWPILVGLAVLQSLSVIAIALLLAAYCPEWPLGRVAGILLACVLTMAWFSADVLTGAEGLFACIEWLGPAGWIAAALRHGLLDGFAGAFLLLIPVGLVIATAPFSIRHIRREYSVEETMPLMATAELLLAQEEQQQTQEPSPQRADDVQPAEMWKRIDWGISGFVERLVDRFLSAREKLLAEFLLGEIVGSWTKDWRRAGIGLLLGMPITLLLGHRYPWIPFAAGAWAAMGGLPVFGGSWLGLGSSFDGAGRSPYYACYPIGYQEMSRLFLKVNTVRFLLLIPLLVLYGGFVGGWLEYGIAHGMLFSAKIAALLAGAQPAFIALQFAMTTTRARRRSLWLGLPIALMVLVLIVVGLTLAWLLMTAVFDSTWTAAVTGLGVWTLLSSGLALFFRWRFERGKTDLAASGVS